MQPISLNYNLENGVNQIKITEKNLSQNCILCQLLGTKTLVSWSKYIKHFFYFYHYLRHVFWIDVICLTCLFKKVKYPLWLVWIFVLQPLNLKNKITKIEHKKIFCGLSKILKNIWWPINIYLTIPTKTLCPPPLTTTTAPSPSTACN